MAVQTGHWSRECRQKRDFSGKGGSSSSFSKGSSSGKGAHSETGAAAVVTSADHEPYFVASVCPHSLTLLEKVRAIQSGDQADTHQPVVTDEVLLVSSPG